MLSCEGTTLQSKFPLWIFVSLKEKVLRDRDRGLGFKLFMAVPVQGKGIQKELERAAKILHDISW